MRRLVALDVGGGPGFVEAVRRLHDAGDAVLPVDQRLPEPARRRLFETLRPAAVLGSDGTETALAPAEPVEDGDAFVVATSGTTGAPRGVVLTHSAIAASATATSARLGVDAGRDRWLCCLPVAHVGGLSVITRALHTGTPLEVHDGFDADSVIEAARDRGATLVSLVPTALARLGAQAGLFRAILLGGSAIPIDRPTNAVATYGMTETASGVVYDGWPLDDVALRVDESGEIHVRGPMLLRAYRGLGDPKDADGWFATGDAGSLSAEGRLVVFGRIAEVIRTGGESVYPVPVEAVLRRHAAVFEVAVVGEPDPEWGERVVAYVESTGTPPSLEELRALVAAELGTVFAPRQLVIVEALPRTAIGKIRREELREVPVRDAARR